jgi:hypothetical protein
MEKTQIPNTFYNSKAEFGLELRIYLFYKYKDNLSLTGKTKTQRHKKAKVHKQRIILYLSIIVNN